MAKKILFIWLVLLMIPFSSVSFSSYMVEDLDAFRFQGPQKVGRSDSGIFYPPYREIVDNLISLEEIYPSFAKVINIGKTEDGVDTFGILIRNNSIQTKNIILISGATHGNEFLNIANRLPNGFLYPETNEFYNFYQRGGAFFVIPIVNPFGFTNRTRYNAKNVDINRDFSNVITGFERFTQKESKNYAQIVENLLSETGASLEVSVDYHCCFRGAILFPWAYTKTPIPSNDRYLFDQIGEILKNQIPDTTYGSVQDMLWYRPDGTTLDYLYGKYNTLAMAYEGRYEGEEKYFQEHLAWWKEIVKKY